MVLYNAYGQRLYLYGAYDYESTKYFVSTNEVSHENLVKAVEDHFVTYETYMIQEEKSRAEGVMPERWYKENPIPILAELLDQRFAMKPLRVEDQNFGVCEFLSNGREVELRKQYGLPPESYRNG